MLSFSSDHYIRVFIRIHKGKTGINKNFSNSGYIFWCRKCDWRKTIGMDLHEASFSCPICQSKLDYGGPLWIGPLNNFEYVEECIRILEDSEKSTIPSKKKILKILNTILLEDNFPPGYFDIHKICDMLNISVAKKTDLILESIRSLGYKAARTHIEPRAIKSNIPIERLKSLLIDFHEKNVI